VIHPFNKTFYLILKGFFASLRMTLAFYNLQGGEKEGGLRPPSFSLSPDHKALCHSDAQRGISFHWINLTLVCAARNLLPLDKSDIGMRSEESLLSLQDRFPAFILSSHRHQLLQKQLFPVAGNGYANIVVHNGCRGFFDDMLHIFQVYQVGPVASEEMMGR